MTILDEVWSDINGFPGYQVSNCGRVRSFWKVPCRGRGAQRVVGDEPKIVPASDDGMGYLKVGLRRDGKVYVRRVHRLVAEAFIPNDDPETKTTVDHIIGGIYGKRNNTVENLQWLSGKENRQKAWSDGTNDAVKKFNEKPIFAIDANAGIHLYFPSLRETAKRLRLNENTLRSYLWQYGECTLDNGYSTYHICYAGQEEILLYGGEDWELRGGLAYYDGFRY